MGICEPKCHMKGCSVDEVDVAVGSYRTSFQEKKYLHLCSFCNEHPCDACYDIVVWNPWI